MTSHMKRFLPFLILAMTLFYSSCTLTKKATVSKEAPPLGQTINPSQDGSSKEKAIVVKSIGEEYDWIKKHYPGSTVQGQALISDKGKHFDLLKFTIADGTKKEVYFDINSFFGKFK